MTEELIIKYFEDEHFINNIMGLARGEDVFTARGCLLKGDPGIDDPRVKEIIKDLKKWAVDLMILLGCTVLDSDNYLYVAYRDPYYGGPLALNATLSIHVYLTRDKK